MLFPSMGISACALSNHDCQLQGLKENLSLPEGMTEKTGLSKNFRVF